MKKRTATLIIMTLALVILMPFAAPAACADDLLESKAVYYTEESDYIDGDCILTATRMMIRRAAITAMSRTVIRMVTSVMQMV